MRNSLKALVLYIIAFLEGYILLSVGGLMNIILSIVSFLCCIYSGYLSIKMNNQEIIEKEKDENG